jgi:hypothetical protein
MPREAGLFTSSAGSAVRGYLKYHANIPPRWIKNARGSRKRIIYALPVAFAAIGDKSLSSSLIELEMLPGPFVCCFWMIIICHWHTVRKLPRKAGGRKVVLTELEASQTLGMVN